MWSRMLSVIVALLALNHLGSGVYGVDADEMRCYNGEVDVELVDGVCVCAAGSTCVPGVGMHCTHGHKLTPNLKTTTNEDIDADAIRKSLAAAVVHGFRPSMCSDCECRHSNVANDDVANDLQRDGVVHHSQMPDTRRNTNVVLSMAFNYSLARHRIFVLSLRDSGYADDIVLFVDHQSFVDETLSRFLREHNVIVRDVSEFNPPDAFMQRHPKLLRYHLYAVEASNAKYADGLVLMIDFRDVVFQGDPFASVVLRGGEWLRFYAEVFPPNMQESYYTYEWIKECWGDSMPKNIGSAVIICSGATMGTPAGVKHYVEEMVNAMKNAPREACMAIAHDQRFHNYLLYTGVFQHVKVLHAGYAEVYNLGYIGRQDRQVQRIKPHRYLHIDDIFNGTLVTNEDYSIPAVLHQYDRFEVLKKIVEYKYTL
eukprot:m.228980 g.228980  ORF g.228980 m.228980 type:complete len:426 (+) comp33550_c0_seq1:347-1624(+)